MSEIRDRFASPKESPESQNAGHCNEMFGDTLKALTWEYFAIRTIFDNL